jgi:UDP-glucose 4-epimerase
VVLTRFRATRQPDFLQAELGGRAKVETLDVTDGPALEAVARRHRTDSLLHLAVPGLGALTPADEYRTNTQGLLNVLETARTLGLRRVTVASSIAVYGRLEHGPFHEDDPLPLTSGTPTEAYKKAEEVLGQHYADRTGLPLVFARIAGIYGPLYHSMANLPSRLTHAAVRGTPPDLGGARAAFADDEGDLCYVKDTALGLQLLHLAGDLPHRVYNLGGGRAVSNGELAEAINRAVPGAEIVLPAGRGPRARPAPYMDLTRARQELGYAPQWDLERAIQDYVAWLRTNQE